MNKALSAIKGAWVAGIISGAITLIVTLLAMRGMRIMRFGALNLIDVVLIFGLTFGIYMKSRACAVIMFVYFVASKIMIFAQTGKPTGLPLAILFAYFFFQGIRGTFAYHNVNKESATAPSA